jgi:aspartate/methionine/tyrosine aminotransferase
MDWLVGFLLGAREHIEPVLSFKSNVDSGIFLAVQAGAEAALSVGAEWEATRDATLRERRALGESLARALGFSVDPDQGGIFVWARAPENMRNVGAFCDEVLQKHRIFVVPGEVFGSQGARYLRISLCAEALSLREALRRVEGKR